MERKHFDDTREKKEGKGGSNGVEKFNIIILGSDGFINFKWKAYDMPSRERLENHKRQLY